MSVAIIADIHANLEALQRVLERIRELGADEIICLGDIVGYNADPNACIDILAREDISCILGNHDAVASGLEEPVQFNPLAKAAVLWTRGQLTQESREFILGLPREKQVSDFYTFHGSIHDTNRYIASRDDVMDNVRLLSALPGAPSIGFFGHTHVSAAIIERRGVVTAELALELLVEAGRKYLINPGSVGQPRDGDPRASFLVYEPETGRITFHRVEYDFRKSMEKIRKAGLPAEYAERLAFGR